MFALAIAAITCTANAQRHYDDLYMTQEMAYDKVISMDDEVTNTLVVHNRVENVYHINSVEQRHYVINGVQTRKLRRGGVNRIRYLPRRRVLIPSNEYYEPTMQYQQVQPQYSCVGDNNKWFFYFQLNSDFLADKSELGHLIDFAKNNSFTSLYIDAYADSNTGNYSVNMQISQARANTIVNILLREGITSDRLFVQCHGSVVQPYNTNNLNRCVTVVAKNR